MADLLIEGPRSVAALGADTGLDPDGLGRLLRFLASLGIFAENDNGEYVNTPRSETLAKNAPISINGLAALGRKPGFPGALEALADALREPGATAWEVAHGVPIFEYLPAHPDEAALFQSAMTGFTGVEAEAVAAAYDFSAIGTLVDVGGSQGVLLARILRANQSLRGVLFDLPIMLEGATELFAAHGVADRATVVGGDFFESVPAGDALILKNILHAWDDERCVAILRSCRKATAARRPGPGRSGGPPAWQHAERREDPRLHHASRRRPRAHRGRIPHPLPAERLRADAGYSDGDAATRDRRNRTLNH